MSALRTALLSVALLSAIATSGSEPAPPSAWSASAISIPVEVELDTDDAVILWHSFAIEADRLDDITAMDAVLHISPEAVGTDFGGAYFVQVTDSTEYGTGVTIQGTSPATIDLNDVVNPDAFADWCYVEDDLCWLDVTVTYGSFGQAYALDVDLELTVDGQGTIPQMVVATF